ncbi:MAG: proteasome assembly chaperone family protein [Marine Group I thaumarchaeote]|nr:MAG: proteasome assembly chaperone family protein [Marine Group I thaumarchaeote]
MSEITEIQKLETTLGNSAVLIIGYPGGGLVGTMSVSYFIESLKMNHLGEFEHPDLPPIVFIENGQIHGAVRLYKKGNMYAIRSDAPLDGNVTKELADFIVKFCSTNKIGKIIILSGLEVMDKNLKERKTYGLVTLPSLEKLLHEENLPRFLTGVIVGSDAVMIDVLKKARIPMIMLYTECNFFFPDPTSAIIAINTLSKILKVKIDTTKLQKRIGSLRLEKRQLMQETIKQFNQEEGLPMTSPRIYG